MQGEERAAEAFEFDPFGGFAEADGLRGERVAVAMRQRDAGPDGRPKLVYQFVVPRALVGGAPAVRLESACFGSAGRPGVRTPVAGRRVLMREQPTNALPVAAAKRLEALRQQMALLERAAACSCGNWVDCVAKFNG